MVLILEVEHMDQEIKGEDFKDGVIEMADQVEMEDKLMEEEQDQD